MSDKTYDILAIIGRLILPAIGTLYFALAKIWTPYLPYAEEIVGTISAVTIFLNAILKIKSDQYWGEEDLKDDWEKLDEDDF